MSKHTPGPWRYGNNADDTKLVIWTGAYPLAIVIDTHEKDANARLITAAPELLEILKEVRLHRLTAGSPLYKKVSNVIDKAEGK